MPVGQSLQRKEEAVPLAATWMDLEMHTLREVSQKEKGKYQTVSSGLESITTNKASGGDRIPVELFQILKDDAVKGLQSICPQIWKIQQWRQD